MDMAGQVTHMASDMSTAGIEAVQAATEKAIAGAVNTLAPAGPKLDPNITAQQIVDQYLAAEDELPVPDWTTADPTLDMQRDPSYVGGLAPGEELIPGVPRPDLSGEELTDDRP